MLRIRTLGASVILAAAGASTGFAADLGTYTPPPASPVYSPAPAWSWAGPYMGLQGGYGWSGSTIAGVPASINGWTGGAYAGYNFQTPSNLVLGIEGDIMAAGKTGTAAGLTVSNNWNASIRGRAGLAVDRFLPYVTAGVAFGGVTANNGSSATQTGWTAGVGMEALLTGNVTGRAEYRYTNLGTANMGGTPVNVTSNDILLGIGVKF